MKNKFMSLRNIIGLVLLIVLSCVAIYLVIPDKTPKKDIPQEQEINYNTQEKEKTLEEYEELAKTGGTKAKFELASEYFQTDNPEYHKKAFELFTELNNEKVPCANIALGDMYYEGKGVEKNIKKAIKLWKKNECSSNYPERIFTGNTYERWLNYLKDTKQAQKLYEEGMKCLDHNCTYEHWDSCGDCIPAFEYFSAASDLGHAEAKYELGDMYFLEYNNCCAYCLDETGDYRSGIDYNKALDFFKQAVKGGSSNAMYMLGHMYLNDYNTDGKDSREAEKWFLKAANAGDENAMFQLSKMYFKGFGVDKDMSKVNYFARKAKQKGDVRANYYLGMLYYEGKFLKQNYKKAFELFNIVAEEQYESHVKGLSRDMLYKMYLNGEGVGKNEEKAKEYGNKNYYFAEEVNRVEELKKSARNGELKAQLELANANYQGDFSINICNGNGGNYCRDIFIPKDYKKAFYWYQKAFKQGSSEAAMKLSEMYEQGKYVSKDLNKAMEYKQKAVELKGIGEQNEKKNIANN